MNLKKVLSPAVMLPALEATDAYAAIDAMVAALAATRGIGDVAPLIEAVRAREARDRTGLEHGIAVPHGKTDAVNELVAGIARLVTPVDFGSRDGIPARLLVMTISPAARSGPHLQFIGEVVRLLRDASHREALLAAPDAAAMYEVMTK